MRDHVLEESLKRLAAEAATRFSTLVASGDEIPFDVAENEGEDTHFYRYVPLTSSYVEARFGQVVNLPSYGPAKGAIAAAGVAASYLERRSLPVPSDPGVRAEEMLKTFVTELWEGASGFSLDLSRLDQALETLDVESRDIRESDLLLVPLAGFEMTLDDVEFSNGVRILRSDSVEAPIEAISSEGTGRDAWQPACLATVPMTSGHDAPREALSRFRQLVTALRLAKEGSVALAPYAHAPVGEGAWRRLETGSIPTRNGTWLMLESDVDRVDRIITRLGNGAVRVPGTDFALARFEAGLERPRSLDGLSDHLLAFRALMAGESITGSSMAVRAAALVEGVTEDENCRRRMEAASDLEIALMKGEMITSVEGESASYLAAWVEDSLRSVLSAAVTGEVGDDLNAAAEEILISNGLESGEGSIGQIGAEEEWDGIPSRPVEPGGAEIHVLRPPTGFAGIPEPPIFEGPPTTGFDVQSDPSDHGFEGSEEDTGVIEMPEIERALGIVREVPDGEEDLLEPAPEPGEITVTAASGTIGDSGEGDPDWLDEARRGITMEWPSPGELGRRRRESHAGGIEPVPGHTGNEFFPRPEAADWDVSELEYPHRRGA